MQNNPSGDKEIFLAALDLPISERQQYLEHACDGDEALRKRIEVLLKSAEAPDKLLDQERIEVAMSAGNDSATLTEQFAETERVGSLIGPYKLLQQIGEGGMGSVFMAQQTKPVDRRVALKIIKPGMDSRQIVARFEAERQALAMMDHPNIAKVLDAGTTQSARPYFVMELVNGIPITQYCDEQHLSTRERLELFVPVCQAVQHAHQKGIIHRDLKPSNILVALYDHRAIPKVIDFGVSKATGQSLTDKTLFTQFGQIIGTLEYMSPEQARRNQLDVDTRSDVYSLGMVLYELLTGTTPFDRKRLREAALDEILRIIRDEEPPRPSARLSTVDTLPSVAANRRIEPVRLRRMLTGDLDWIVMKSLEKDRARRYETANGFADDIGRYLANEPVVACPPSRTYRMRKFARRNRRLLATLTSLAAVLMCATVLSTWWGIRASNAERAERLISESYKNLSDEKTALAVKEKAARLKSEENEKLAISERERAEENAAMARHNQYIAHMQQLRHEWNNNDVGRVREILDRYRTPVAGQADERGWEWDYWDRMCHLDLRTLEGHTSSVNGIAFSPDSSQIASASTDGTIKLWETATGRLIRTIEGHRAPVTSIAFHPDGKTIGAGDAKNFAILWDSHTGQELHKLQHDFAINCVAFSPNGDLFATGTLRSKEGSHRMIWRVADGSQVKSFSKPNQVRSISFNGDGTRIICATDPDIESWEIESGQLSIIASHRTMKDNNFEFEQVTSAIVSPDQKTLVTASMDRAVKIWDMDSKRELLSIPAHREGITSVAINASENMIASASVDRSIRVWNSITGTEQLVLRGHSGAVQQVAFSPDGFRLASASRDGTVKIWDSTLRMDFRALLASYSCHYLSHSFRPEGNEIVYGRFLNGIGDIGPLAEVRDASSHELIREFHGGHRHWIRSIVMSSDGKLLATAGGDSVLIRNMVTGENLHEIKGIPRVLNGGLLFSPDGTLLVVQFPDVDKQNNRIIPSQKVYDTATGKQLYGRIANVGCVAFTRDGGMLAIASKESIEFIEPKTGSTIRSWKHAGNATNLHYSPDGKFLAANTKTTDVCMWDASTGRLIREISNAGKLIGFSPTGLRVFSVPQRESLNVWDVTTGDLLCIIASPKRSTFSESAISADGSLIAIRNIPDIDILDVRPLTKEINVQRETQSLAAKLLKSPFGEPPQLLERKSEVLARLKEIKSVPEAVRQSAARLIEATLRPYDESMELVYVAGGLLEGDDLTDPTRPTYSDGTGLPTLEQSKLALEYAVKAFEIDENVFSTGTLGTALCENGRYAESLNFLERVFKDPSLSAESRAQMLSYHARALFFVGNLEKAKESLKEVKSSPYARHPSIATQIKLAAALLEPTEKPPAPPKRESEK